MRTSLRIVIRTSLVFALSSAHSFAVSIDDQVNLRANGLADELFVALIDQAPTNAGPPSRRASSRRRLVL